MCRCELRVRWKLSSAHSAATTRPYWQTHCMFPSVFISVLNYCITFALCMLLHCFSEDLWYMCHERSTGVCIENALFFSFFFSISRAKHTVTKQMSFSNEQQLAPIVFGLPSMLQNSLFHVLPTCYICMSSAVAEWHCDFTSTLTYITGQVVAAMLNFTVLTTCCSVTVFSVCAYLHTNMFETSRVL